MHFNDGWSWGGAGHTPQFTREQYGHQLQLASGSPSPHGVLTHLYLNGVYWGLLQFPGEAGFPLCRGLF